MSTKTQMSRDQYEDAYIAHAEHLAFKEFECMTGDCATCEEFHALQVETQSEEARTDSRGVLDPC